MIICLLHASARPTPVYREIAGHLRASGHQVWSMELDERGNVLWNDGIDKMSMQKGLPAYSSKLPSVHLLIVLWARLRKLVFIWRMRQKIRALRPDIVQVNPAGLQPAGLIPLAMPRETAFIVDYRQIGDRRRPTNLAIRLRNRFRSLTRRISAIYGYDHSLYLHPSGANKGLGLQWEQWGTVVPMGVHDSFLEVERPLDSEKVSGKGVRFIYIGSMVRQRKLEILFQAIRLVANGSEDFEFHFLGRDKSDGYYDRLVAKLDLEPYVKLIPPIPYEEVPQRLVEYDAAIAYVPDEPTDWSYHPTLKVIEYRAAGMPIIATDVVPNHEYVQPGCNGFLCKNTADEFAEAMNQFIDNPQLLEQAKDYASRNRDGFTWVEVSQLYENLYRQILSGRRRQADSAEDQL